MSNFPLYDNLLKNIKKRDLTTKQKDEFIDLVNGLDEHGVELIYALIRTHKQHSSKTSEDVLPYSGVNNDGSLEFDLEKFPSTLKQVLYKFLGMHIKNMQEESQISAHRT